MATSAISAAYWRKVKAGERTYESVPAAKSADVLILAKSDVAQNVITSDDFKNIIGTDYEA